MKDNCEHHILQAENPRVKEISYEEFVIIEFDVMCEKCGKNMGVEKQRYTYERTL